MGAVQGVFSVCCNTNLLWARAGGLRPCVYRVRLGEADRDSYTQDHLTDRDSSHVVWSSGKANGIRSQTLGSGRWQIQ